MAITQNVSALLEYFIFILKSYNQLKMRRNSTLPTIRQAQPASSSAKGKEGNQSFRKIEAKINNHDEQIIRNDKIISNLANQFRMLKQQLQFQKDYSEKFKSTIIKYEQETTRHTRIIKQQKQTIIKMEHAIRERDKAIEAASKEKTQLKQRIEELHLSVEQIARDNKKKESFMKDLESKLQKAKREIKQKQNQLKLKDNELKQKQIEIKQAFGADRQVREMKIKKLEKDVELLNSYLQNSKEILNSKQKQLKIINLQVFQLEQKLRQSEKHDLKAKNLMDQIRLFQKQNEDLRKTVKEVQQKNKSLQISIKTMESKSKQANNQRMKQLGIEKKEIIEKFTREIQDLHKNIEEQRRQKVRIQQREAQLKDLLNKYEAFSQKVSKQKSSIVQELGKLKSNTQCDYCNKPMKNPVTNIPCGHSYCQQCKAGYLKQCKKCSGVKREAVYRNQLLDEVINASNLVQKIVLLLTI